ncbi:MAG: DUF4129 domain-containing protein [Tannerella sp.]|jgi:hypothetical protein|nr:DUF4129 domain-containing protein [Tannerella sp.]
MAFQVADTVVYDVKKIAEYQADARFDYNSQPDMSGYGWFELVSRWFNRLLNSIFSGRFEERYTTPVMIALFLIALVAVLYFLYRKRPTLFMRSRKTAVLPYDAEEENIREMDFDREIASALEAGNYRLAVRMIYLQTLRLLSDGNLVDWQIHKTPTEYLYEVGNGEVKRPFRELTVHFLQVRYGNYRASPERFDAMRGIQRQIRDVIAPTRNSRRTVAEEVAGGVVRDGVCGAGSGVAEADGVAGDVICDAAEADGIAGGVVCDAAEDVAEDVAGGVAGKGGADER